MQIKKAAPCLTLLFYMKKTSSSQIQKAIGESKNERLVLSTVEMLSNNDLVMMYTIKLIASKVTVLTLTAFLYQCHLKSFNNFFS